LFSKELAGMATVGTIVFLFHRDLRIVDHTGLRAAAAEAKARGARVLPLFVFTPEQVSDKNKLRSVNSVQFMLASLQELETAIHADGGRLAFAYGETPTVLRALHKRLPGGLGGVVETRDYTPYAKKREAAVAAVCASLGAQHILVEDSYLLAPGTVKTQTGRTFQKFTPFYETVRHSTIPRPLPKVTRIPWLTSFSSSSSSSSSFLSARRTTRRTTRPSSLPSPPFRFPHQTTLAHMARRFVPYPNPHIAVKGGRKEGLRLLQTIPRDYADVHDVPAKRTSMLSAHNHYGTVSIREVYHRGKALGLTAFVRQLWWRDFYGHIMADFETLYNTHPYEFQRDPPRPLSPRQLKDFEAWCTGTTGVPLVDAGMKELLTTGYMHNRVRLVVASWLVKDRGVHWRLGERFFAQHLVDYDATQNMMNWIWVASVLPFASAPFRKIDAYRTAEKFNTEGEYVGRWIDTAAL
jgi:deoxyribodipyrimidine photo-lyase